MAGSRAGRGGKGCPHVKFATAGPPCLKCRDPGYPTPETKIKLVFRAEDDADPPFVLKIKAPSGKVILERVIRDLPTGLPQSAPPVGFTASAGGEYKVEIKQVQGRQKGEAVLRVVD
jgi:hypothetical protein